MKRMTPDLHIYIKNGFLHIRTETRFLEIQFQLNKEQAREVKAVIDHYLAPEKKIAHEGLSKLRYPG